MKVCIEALRKLMFCSFCKLAENQPNVVVIYCLLHSAYAFTVV